MMIIALKDLNKVIKFFARKEILLILCVVLLLAPLLLRLDKPLAGEKSYFFTRTADSFKEGIIPFYDSLSYGGRNLLPVFGWPLLIAFFSYIFNVTTDIVSRILPFVLGILSFLLFYRLTSFLSYEIRALSSFLFIISPPFLYLFTHSTEYLMVVFLTLLAMLLFIKNKNASYTAFALLPLFSISGAIASLLIMFFYLFATGNKKYFTKFLIAVLLVSLIYLPFVILNGLPERISLAEEQGINMIFDLGAPFGIGVFMLILSFFGLGMLWGDKYEYLTEYMIFFILIILSIYFNVFLFFLNMFVAVLAALGLIKFVKMKWQSKLIKRLSIMIIISGLLFSGVSYINQFNNEIPNKNIIDGLTFLKNQDDGVVLSHYKNGVWINTVANKKNVVDSMVFYAPDINSRFDNVKMIFNSRNIDESRWIIDIYNIKYVYIDKNMKSILWGDKDEGLYFILKYSMEFKKIYKNEDVEIWEYVGKP